jgi:hypothetical protein
VDNNGVFLSAVRRWADAVAAREEAVQIRRRLATGNPAKFRSDLAPSLSNLGMRLWSPGRHEDALTTVAGAPRPDDIGQPNSADAYNATPVWPEPPYVPHPSVINCAQTAFGDRWQNKRPDVLR